MELKDVRKPVLYSVKEVAEQMGIRYNKLYRIIKAGQMKVVNIATKGAKPIYRVRAEDVQHYYDNLSNSAARIESEHERNILGNELAQAPANEGKLPERHDGVLPTEEGSGAVSGRDPL